MGDMDQIRGYEHRPAPIVGPNNKSKIKGRPQRSRSLFEGTVNAKQKLKEQKAAKEKMKEIKSVKSYVWNINNNKKKENGKKPNINKKHYKTKRKVRNDRNKIKKNKIWNKNGKVRNSIV